MGKLVRCSVKNRIKSELYATDMKIVLILAVLCLVLGILSAFVAGGFDLYSELCLPDAAMPGFVFPLVWSVLYLSIGAASGMVIASKDKCLAMWRRKGLAYFFAMLALNLMWAPTFFGAGMLFIAFVIICAMLPLTFFTLLCYGNVTFVGGIVMLVYLLWLIFTAYLNLAILFLN